MMTNSFIIFPLSEVFVDEHPIHTVHPVVVLGKNRNCAMIEAFNSSKPK